MNNYILIKFYVTILQEIMFTIFQMPTNRQLIFCINKFLKLQIPNEL